MNTKHMIYRAIKAAATLKIYCLDTDCESCIFDVKENSCLLHMKAPERWDLSDFYCFKRYEAGRCSDEKDQDGRHGT